MSTSTPTISPDELVTVATANAIAPELELVYATQCLPAPFPGGRLMALFELERSMRGQQVPEWLKQR